MNTKPLISYVVTTYNIEEFVEESVKCAFAQTYSPLEIVLSDDCSSDHTYDIIRKMAQDYKGPHKIVLNRNEHNMGITQHMNKVFMEIASGEIIVVAHGDDISVPERTEVMHKYLQDNPEWMQVACSVTVVDKNKNILDEHIQKKVRVNEVRTYEFGTGAHVPIGFSAFRKEIMSFFGRLNDVCPTEDDAIGFRAIMLGKIAFIPEKMIIYRKHDNSNSNPHFFERFPLNEIFQQNILDMDIALERGIIDREQYSNERNRLYKAKEKREIYRYYYSKRNIESLFRIIKSNKFRLREKLSWVKEHIEFLKGHHE